MNSAAHATFVRADGTPARILVVDDEAVLAELLAASLRHQGWDTKTAGNGWEGLDLADDFDPDIVVLDIQMPGLDGMETLSRLRKKNPHLPVLFLTARDAVADRVAGLRAGADDYVTKPFDLDEVTARIDALLRRSGMASATVSHVLTVGDLVLDEDSHDVTRDGEPVSLTNTEFELLRYLMENPNVVLSKSQILDRVWSYDFGGQANVVELYISYLRKKLETDRTPMIHTVRGAGYILRPGEDIR
ncbi:response regulator transcription factor [Schaalia vaccimaxillae]|uniref:response regulator transcription factor n=1 Tax=Schaalia vaccimaxillae TaxID=183916 RepID=UPI0003B746BB|nr:response regulator transcription factor [Schaalia vaccimaxillae]